MKERASCVQRLISTVTRRAKKSNGGGRTSIHCNVDPCSAEILLKTVVSVSLFRISRAGSIGTSSNLRLTSSIPKNTSKMALNLVTYLTMHETNSRFVQSTNAKAMASRKQPKLLKLEEKKILAEPESQNLWKRDIIFEVCAALQLIKLGIKTAFWECTAMERATLGRSKKVYFGVGCFFSSVLLFSWRGDLMREP